jgi:multifunctional 2-oxoglutarate metabolism enzyme
VLVNIVGKEVSRVFAEFDDRISTEAVQGSGDVKYHLGAVGKYVSRDGNPIVVELAANPSHLETVDPIVLGMVRARQDHTEPQYAYSYLPLLLHGDAAFAGQGLVAECLNMSDISGYRVGGTIHVITNNQVGFTTSPEFARSSQSGADPSCQR